MLTKAQIKYIQSLSRQKYRKEHNAYLVEGDKNAKEWLQSNATIQYVVTSKEWYTQNESIINQHQQAHIAIVPDFELEKMTALQHAQQVILVVAQPEPKSYASFTQNWTIFLDKIQDPGNMGTIIRTADWFGIHQMVCTPDCVEVFNPKVVQASMGSLLRLQITQMDTATFLQQNTMPIYAAALNGSPINTLKQKTTGVIAMGNESQGLSPTLFNAAQHLVKIPGYGQAESLNVAVATGIICSWLTLT